jgi:transposase
MQPYSQDLRRCVIAALKTGQHSQVEIAHTFGIHVSTVEKWWRRWRETRSCAVLTQTHGPGRALRDGATFLRTEIKRQPDVTLAELCVRAGEAKGVSASPSMMCCEQRRLRLPRQKAPA